MNSYQQDLQDYMHENPIVKSAVRKGLNYYQSGDRGWAWNLYLNWLIFTANTIKRKVTRSFI